MNEKSQKGQMVNGVKWGRRVGHKEKFLQDLDMEVLCNFGESSFRELVGFLKTYVFGSGICSRKTNSKITLILQVFGSVHNWWFFVLSLANTSNYCTF